MNSKFRRVLFTVAILGFISARVDTTNTEAVKGKENLIIYQFDIKDEIAKPVWRITQRAFEEAGKLGAAYILIHMNTYGGMVNIADSIRTKILNSHIPVMVYIDNQAISAGALISIACDSIYMRAGGSIGAATVVNQTGEQVPDKYQSFMRSTMRATAEAHGRDTIIRGNDTIVQWHRDPKIAEAMVDPVLEVEGIVEEGQVLTFTAEEALQNNYCEGIADNVPAVLKMAGLSDYEVVEYKATGIDKIIGFLLSPLMQGLLIMIIIGGIYFELQTPGIGFPLAAAATAALLYFAPLYLEGLAQNWELIVFVAGLILLGFEIFVIPGFGVAGVSGIILVITGLTMAMIDNIVFEFEGIQAMDRVLKAFLIVVISVSVAFVGSIIISKQLFTSKTFRLALNTVQKKEEGYISIDLHQKEMIGKTGIAYTILRPSGMVQIDGEIFDAKAEIGYIEKGEKIKVIRDEAGQLYVIKA
ncbi:MAG: nodulation protein NfeD [Bacteroidales bacterium]|nr:nodulation protein NfeD [Bacteroidales bacterium]